MEPGGWLEFGGGFLHLSEEGTEERECFLVLVWRAAVMGRIRLGASGMSEANAERLTRLRLASSTWASVPFFPPVE